MTNEIAKTSEQSVQLPDYLKSQQFETTGTEEMQQYLSPGYIKVVQAMSRDLVSQGYKEGDVLLTPLGIHVAKLDQPFAFWPLYFYVEYLQTNPVGKDPFVIAKSRDPDSELAKRARDPEQRGDADSVRYSEHLNFIGIIPHVSQNEPVVISFSKGSHKQGRTLCTLINMRSQGAAKVPIFVCRFQITPKMTSNKTGQKYVTLFPENPRPEISEPFAPQEDVEALEATHKSLAKMDIRVDYNAELDGDDDESEV